MKTNTKSAKVYTHEGGRADKISPEMQLRRSVLSCLLWEDGFYENGEDIATRIANLVKIVEPETVSLIAKEARTVQHLRHVPLHIVREMARIDGCKPYVSGTLHDVIQRADELSEFLSIYYKNGKQPLSSQVKKGLASAFKKFDSYALGRYANSGAIKLRDVLFLTHPKPDNKEQANLWKRLANKTLEYPENTWESRISATNGEGKKEAWIELLKDNALGALALIRNLRNLIECGVDNSLIRKALKNCNPEKVLPFRFIAAAKYAPAFEPELEELMFKCLKNKEKLSGNTALIIDVSGSMIHQISGKSELSRRDAASALGMLLREIAENVDIYTFSKQVVQIAPRRGFALKDVINNSQPNLDTKIAPAIHAVNEKNYDRVIVITDGQIEDELPESNAINNYIINIASFKNGIGYKGSWTNIDGWSEAVVDYISLYENYK